MESLQNELNLNNILSKYKKVDKLSTAVLSLYLILSFLSLYETQLLLINSSIALIGLIVFCFNFNYIRSRHFPILIVATIFACYSLMCLYLFQGKLTFTPIRVFVHFSLFILILRFQLIESVFKWLLYLYVTYIGYLLFIEGVYINSIFPGTSKNIIGWFAIGISVLYYVVSFDGKSERRKPSMIPAIVTLVICLISLSRSNIICSGILMLGVLFNHYKSYSIIKKTFFIFLTVFVLIFLSYILYDLVMLGLQRFDERGLESFERSLFLESYLEKIDPYTFFLGVNSDQYPFTLINGNFHNSFLLGHSNFGFMFLLFVIFIVTLLLRRGFRSVFMSILVIVLLFRSFTDTIMFIGDFDFILLTTLHKIYKN